MNEHEERGPADEMPATQPANPIEGEPEEVTPARNPAEGQGSLNSTAPESADRMPGAGAQSLPPAHPRVYRSSEVPDPRPASQPGQAAQPAQAAQPGQVAQPGQAGQLGQAAQPGQPPAASQRAYPTQPLPAAGQSGVPAAGQSSGFAGPTPALGYAAGGYGAPGSQNSNAPGGYPRSAGGPAAPTRPAGPSGPSGPGSMGPGSAVPGSAPQPSWGSPEPVKKVRRGPGWMALIAVGLIASLLGGTIGVGVMAARWGTARPAATPTSTTSGVTKTVSTVEGTDWQAVAAAVSNAVVSINVSGASGGTAGSGFIIDAEGRIITNDHVVSGAQQVYVTLSDSRVYQAEIVGTDEATDLAVIQLVDPPKDLTVARLGDSSGVQVGQSVAAIGNPLGLSSTMTTGIVSALDRPVQTVTDSNPAQATRVVTNAIQVDAAVNPGNSGGPVFDSTGAVIGVASSIATLSGGESSQSGSIGLGFAIPINQAKKVADQLISDGVAEHAFLGVTIVDGVGKANGTSWKGAQISRVEPSTPAAEANLQAGDVILKVNDRDVSSGLALTGYVRQFSSGDVVTLLVARNGELVNVDVTLATRVDEHNRG